MKSGLKKYLIVVAGLTHIAVSGCSGNKQEEAAAEEPVAADAASDVTPDAPDAPVAPDAPASSSAATPADAGVPSAPAESLKPAADSTAPMMMNTSRRVMYVKANGTAVREKAEPKAAVVRKLDRGDHILVTIEGDWARTDDGKYIAVKSLSEKGIGRGKKDASWSAGNPSEAAVKGTKKSAAKAGTPAKTEGKANEAKAAKDDAKTEAPKDGATP